ncbi:MAG: hypothetical protein K2W94_09250 [Alphaproteobacteria bacterium]|nr:hypothetical protein [Alphaproteobacteria bacterium]
MTIARKALILAIMSLVACSVVEASSSGLKRLATNIAAKGAIFLPSRAFTASSALMAPTRTDLADAGKIARASLGNHIGDIKQEYKFLDETIRRIFNIVNLLDKEIKDDRFGKDFAGSSAGRTLRDEFDKLDLAEVENPNITGILRAVHLPELREKLELD